ncbi:MAG: PspC domain-containing protein [Actinobacteria bacterium]|nr:PspC domain-containing protein [Actinomycetota bacterium]
MSTPQHTRPARLTRSRDDRVIAGIAGGLAKYLGVDPVLVRLGFVALALIAGGGILAYLIAWLVIPEEPAGEGAADDRSASPPASGKARIVVGIALIAIGIGVLAEWAIPDFGDVFWPLVVLVIGGGLVYTGVRR